MKGQRQVFAILRFDEFADSSVAVENRITVVEIVEDDETARIEVQRLNELNKAKGCRYYFQATRLRSSDA